MTMTKQLLPTMCNTTTNTMDFTSAKCSYHPQQRRAVVVDAAARTTMAPSATGGIVTASSKTHYKTTKDKKKIAVRGGSGLVACSGATSAAKKSKLSMLQRMNHHARVVTDATRRGDAISSSNMNVSSPPNSILPLDMPIIHIQRGYDTPEEQQVQKETFGWADLPVLRRMKVPIQP